MQSIVYVGLGKLDWEFSGIVSAGFHVEQGESNAVVQYMVF